jgi:hypothetical protein
MNGSPSREEIQLDIQQYFGTTGRASIVVDGFIREPNAEALQKYIDNEKYRNDKKADFIKGLTRRIAPSDVLIIAIAAHGNATGGFYLPDFVTPSSFAPILQNIKVSRIYLLLNFCFSNKWIEYKEGFSASAHTFVHVSTKTLGCSYYGFCGRFIRSACYSLACGQKFSIDEYCADVYRILQRDQKKRVAIPGHSLANGVMGLYPVHDFLNIRARKLQGLEPSRKDEEKQEPEGAEAEEEEEENEERPIPEHLRVNHNDRAEDGFIQRLDRRSFRRELRKRESIHYLWTRIDNALGTQFCEYARQHPREDLRNDDVCRLMERLIREHPLSTMLFDADFPRFNGCLNVLIDQGELVKPFSDECDRLYQVLLTPAQRQWCVAQAGEGPLWNLGKKSAIPGKDEQRSLSIKEIMLFVFVLPLVMTGFLWCLVPTEAGTIVVVASGFAWLTTLACFSSYRQANRITHRVVFLAWLVFAVLLLFWESLFTRVMLYEIPAAIERARLKSGSPHSEIQKV